MAHDTKNESRKTGVAGWNEDAGTVTSSESSRSQRRKKTQFERVRRIVLLVLLAALCVGCVVCFWPLKDTVNRGLWLKGGTAITLEATKDDGSEPSDDELKRADAVIARRLNDIGVPESTVDHQGSSIVMRVPNGADADALGKYAGGSGTLEFVRLDEIGDADALQKVNAGTSNVPLKQGSYTAFLDASAVTSCEVTEVSNGYYAVTVHFNQEGEKTFASVTKEMSENGGGNIAIVLNGNVSSAPSVSQEITGGSVTISGGFSESDARTIKAVIDSGSLPVRTTVKGSEKISATIGNTGKWVLVGVAAVFVVAVSVAAFVRFRRLGVIVLGVEVVYVLTMLGLMAAASRLNMFTLTQTGVAGGALAVALTTVFAWSMCSVFQDMVRSGKSVRGAGMSCAQKAFGAVRVPWILGFVVSCVLMFVPIMVTRYFAFVFIFGTVCGVVSLLWYAVTLLRLLSMGAIQKSPAAWGAEVEGSHFAPKES